MIMPDFWALFGLAVIMLGLGGFIAAGFSVMRFADRERKAMYAAGWFGDKRVPPDDD